MPLLTSYWAALLALTILISSCKPPPKVDWSESSKGVAPYFELTPELEKKVAGVSALVENKIRSKSFNGVVLVAQYGNIIYSRAHGFANYKTKDTLSLHSVFQLASVSKMFTAAAVLKLRDMGKINLEDKVSSYLPLFPFEDVTIKNLLQHRSGIPRYMVTSDLYWSRDTMMTNEDMYYLMAENCPSRYFPPGHRYNYQNSNYAYLAYLVEVVSEIPFHRFVRTELFEPAGMFDSYVFEPEQESRPPGVVMGHIYRRPRVVFPEENYINGVVGDKGVYSNVIDLLKYDQMLYSDSILSEKSIIESFIPGGDIRKSRRVSDGYGFGWRVSKFPKDRLVYHYGWWNGFKTCFMRFLNERRTVIILTNRDRTLSLPKEIREILYEDQADTISAMEYFSSLSDSSDTL